ncbi:MAG TPA: hypothetical protein PKA64_14270, partial [Myxococcota bacterium]|nr:hypothetical protein [Myxococcota bacterium]
DRSLRVGRNAAGNHRLVFRASRGRDWWLHLRDAPSAHVVVPSADGAPPDPATLAAAVEALLLTARVPEGVQVDVRLARVADLRPVPGGHPGEVQITRERVIVGRRDPSALHGWIRADVVPRGPRGG